MKHIWRLGLILTMCAVLLLTAGCSGKKTDEDPTGGQTQGTEDIGGTTDSTKEIDQTIESNSEGNPFDDLTEDDDSSGGVHDSDVENPAIDIEIDDGKGDSGSGSGNSGSGSGNSGDNSEDSGNSGGTTEATGSENSGDSGDDDFNIDFDDLL